MMARYADGRKKPVNYEETLSEEELKDLNSKLVAFWSSIVKKYPYKPYKNQLGKYEKRVIEQ